MSFYGGVDVFGVYTFSVWDGGSGVGRGALYFV